MTAKNEYGNALFLLAVDEGAIKEVKSDLEAMCAVLKSNPDYVRLLDTPAMAKSEKLMLIDNAFRSLHYSVVNLLKILCEKHLVYSFSSISETYSVLYDEYSGIERVEAVSAVAMTDAQKNKLKEKLEKLTGKKIVIKNTVKPEILGGVILRYSGTQLDGSVKSRLDSFSQSLRNLNL